MKKILIKTIFKSYDKSFEPRLSTKDKLSVLSSLNKSNIFEVAKKFQDLKAL